MKVLVCGSRHWTHLQPILDRLAELPQLSTVIEGGAEGADQLARAAARVLGHDLIEFPANWNGRGRSAGPYRNRLMLDLKPDLVIAFHENIEASRGTRDTVTEAQRRKIMVEIHGLRKEISEPEGLA